MANEVNFNRSNTNQNNSNISRSKSNPKKMTQYYKSERLTWERFKEMIPKEMIPTQAFNYFFAAIAIIIVILGSLTFPLKEILSPQAMLSETKEVMFTIGWPMSFFVLDFKSAEGVPFKIPAIIVDLIIYLILAYALNLLWNFLLRDLISKIGKEKQAKEIKPNVKIKVVGPPVNQTILPEK